MSRLNYKDGLNFEIYVMDLCEIINPQKASDFNDFSEDLHERVEMTIQDYIYDNELNLDEYEGAY